MPDLYVFQNPNPAANRTEDCVLRAICILEDMDWLSCYWKLCYLGAQMYIVPNNNESVVRALLLQLGYKSNSLPDTCPVCYTVKDFCLDHPKGKYLLTTNSHAVAVIDGRYFDSFDSGDELPIFMWSKEEKE